MMMDIFSSFDPANSSTYIPWMWLFMIINMTAMLYPSCKWAICTRTGNSMTSYKSIIIDQVSRTNMKMLKGYSLIITSLFMFLVLINLMGMSPYVFSLSSHLLFTLSLGLPLWLSMIISSFTAAPKKSTAHFLPDGAPDWLNPFLVLIETTSIMVRPLTLSFRLAANMTAGHIVLTLISTYAAGAIFSSLSPFIILILTAMGYIMFELAICLIQAYIFCLLLSLYSDDHAH